MVDVADRQSLLDRLVALNGGKASIRRAYASFSEADLAIAVADAEAVERDVARHGRLGAVWQDSGGEIVEPAADRTKGKDAAE